MHSWVDCHHAGEKPRAVRAAVAALRPRCALLFLADDAPLKRAVAELRDLGLDAEMLHEAMGFGADAGADAGGGGALDGYAALRASLRDRPAGALADGAPPDDAAPLDAASHAGCRLLVSTQGSARGLDLAQVDCVLLYALPDAADAYLHLAGRTGRQGRAGHVISLLTPDEAGGLGRITRQLGLSIKPHAKIALELDGARRATP